MSQNKINQTIKDIKAIEIQGATAIAREGLKALINYTAKLKADSIKSFSKKIISSGRKLAYARPNEPLLQNAVGLVERQLKLLADINSESSKEHIKNTVDFYQELIKANDQRIVDFGYKLIKKDNNILTHCHSSTVEKILKQVHKKKIKFSVFVGETRPLYQGRITARNLAKAGVKVTQVADSASGFLISPYSGKGLMMDKIIIGADVIKTDGSILNKIGSYDIAASAYLNKIPFYVAVNLLKYKNTKEFDIEKRSADEIWKARLKKIKVINYAFDVVPAKFITGLITEFGIIKPSEVKKFVKKYYPWIS